MSKKTPQDYANELIKMYRENAAELLKTDETISADKKPLDEPAAFKDGIGGLQAVVTTLSRIYPVGDALVTIFTGDIKNKNIIKSGTTNQSGMSEIFKLKAPPAASSQQAKSTADTPYANYNISVKSDGYVEQIALNIPIFSGVVSVQGFDLLPIAAAGKNTSPQIIDEKNNYNL